MIDDRFNLVAISGIALITTGEILLYIKYN